MRVGLVCPYNIFKGGGVQECAKEIKSELIARGHDAVIITPRPREIPINHDTSIVFLGNSTDIKSPFHTTGQVSATVNYRLIDELLKKYNFDILHFHEPWVPILSQQILSRSKAINVATFHAKLPDTIVSRTIEHVITPYTKSILKKFDGLTAVSNAAADYVGMLTKKPIKIIPNGIDLDNYKNVKHKETKVNGKIVFYIGRLERRKGIKYLIEAFNEIKKTDGNEKLIIAGHGPEKKKLNMLIKSLGTKDIEFVGYVGEKKKHELFSNCDVFCSPATFGESFGIVLLEAMAYDVPIVAGNNPGYVDVMKDTGQLSIVNPKDTEEFARRLKLMLYDHELIKLWKNWANKYVEQFSYHKVVDEYEHLYEDLIKKRHL